MKSLKTFFLKKERLTAFFVLLLISITIRYMFEFLDPHILVLPTIQNTIFAIVLMYVLIFLPLLLVPISNDVALRESKVMRVFVIVYVIFLCVHSCIKPDSVSIRSDMYYICILSLLGVFFSKHLVEGFISFKNREAENCIE